MNMIIDLQGLSSCRYTLKWVAARRNGRGCLENTLLKWRAERSILPSVSPAREPSGNDAYGAGETRRNEGVSINGIEDDESCTRETSIIIDMTIDRHIYN